MDLLLICQNTHNSRIKRPNIPLKAYSEDNIFKLYMPDIGLLSAMTALDPRAYLEPNNAIFNHFKGVLAEQFAFQELRASDERLPTEPSLEQFRYPKRMDTIYFVIADRERSTKHKINNSMDQILYLLCRLHVFF